MTRRYGAPDVPSTVREPQRAFMRMNGVALTLGASLANRIAVGAHAHAP